jgi:DNA ligase D-like protein (predicted ligase)
MLRITSKRLDSLPRKLATFIEPMECLPVTKLPEGQRWLYEVKLDGYRAIAVKQERNVILYSRRRNSLNRKFPLIIEALREIPEGTVVDGELVAVDESGHPNFNLLQNFRSKATNIYYYVFDLLFWENHSLIKLPYIERRVLLKEAFQLPSEHIKISEYMDVSAAEMVEAVREHGLEGVVGKRRDSIYEPGQRSGAWVKVRSNRGQEFVIGGFVPGSNGVESIIVGYNRQNKLIYVAKIKNGFVPLTRRELFEKLKKMVAVRCPFVNLPESHKGRWGQGLTAEDMKKCVWVRPKIVAQIEFLEWTGADHLRHARFIALRDDKDSRTVVKENL